jgi:ketosteroid isomerase-like protein
MTDANATTTPAAATALEPVLTEHLRAVNAFDLDAIVATFAEDALVNDARREFWGIEAIRAWVEKEMVGDKVTLDVTEVLNHRDQTLVRARYDGEYDKTNLPGELIMTNYFTVRDGKIVTLFVIRNQDA